MKKIEGHNVEYKSAWRDEYLEWISGFANAYGGSVFIGVDDKGKPKKSENIKKLSEDLPNKIRDILGVIVDVFVHHRDGVVENSVEVEDFSVFAFDLFLKKAIDKGRMSENIDSLSVSQKLEKLHLLDNKKITRAAILIFHPNPEVYIPGSYLKIGAFRDDGTLIYHDEI